MTEQAVGTGGVGLPEYTRVGPYRLLQRLGEGGMGVVHLALDPGGKAVAIKVLRPHIAADPAARTRLLREVETLSRIRHPNVAPIVDQDVTGDLPYIVTRYIAGPSLDQVVETDGPLRGPALLQFGRGLAGALHAIHEAGVVHRDVKPGNILLLDGEPILIDFGIAHVADDVRLTRTGLVMGTPGYLSPEIVEGAEVTDSTDWWGWAATLAFAAQGRPPFGRGSMETILSRVVRGAADLSGVDPALVPLLEAALSPEAEDRPTDTEVLRAMERYAEGGDVTDVLRVVPGRGAGGDSLPATQVIAPGSTALLPPVAAPPPRVAPAPTAAGQQADRPRSAAAASQAPGPSGPAEPAGGSGSRGNPGSGYASAPPPWSATGLPYRVAQEDLAPPGHADPAARATPPPRRTPAAHTPEPDRRPAQQWPGAAQPSYDPMHEPMRDPVGGGNQAYQWPGEQVDPRRPLPPRPVMAGDPRIGRATRGGVLAALAGALIAGAAAMPTAAILAALTLSVLARTADRSVTALVIRRHSKGERSSDLARSVLASPVHLVTGLIATLAGALIPAAVGLAGVFAGLLAARLSLPSAPEDLVYSASLACGMALALMMAWWGPGGAGLRRGSRSLARGLAPGPAGAQLVGGLLLVAATGIAAWVILAAAAPMWWPATDAPAILSTLTRGT